MAWFTFLHAQRTSIDDTDARKRVFLARLANLFGETRQSTNPLALQSLAWKGSPKADPSPTFLENQPQQHTTDRRVVSLAVALQSLARKS
jgi:hypothetical protein